VSTEEYSCEPLVTLVGRPNLKRIAHDKWAITFARYQAFLNAYLEIRLAGSDSSRIGHLCGHLPCSISIGPVESLGAR
jgi:hypothetical protein